jgi:hypothetical protein
VEIKGVDVASVLGDAEGDIGEEDDNIELDQK